MLTYKNENILNATETFLCHPFNQVSPEISKMIFEKFPYSNVTDFQIGNKQFGLSKKINVNNRLIINMNAKDIKNFRGCVIDIFSIPVLRKSYQNPPSTLCFPYLLNEIYLQNLEQLATKYNINIVIYK